MFSFDDNRPMRRYAFEAFISHLVWCFFLFGFTEGFVLPFAAWIERFYQWDARWYGTMAQDGHGFLPQTYVFPPLHGWVLGRLTDVAFLFCKQVQEKPSWVLCFYAVALVFGVACFAIANSVLVALAERRFKIDRTRLWIFALANPMGYFALTPYSDMFFFALFAVTMLLLLWTSPRREAWNLRALSTRTNRGVHAALAALFFLSPWVRLTGFAYGIWLFLKRKEVFATFFSLAVFLLYYWIRTDNPFFFLLAQQAFMMPAGGFFTGLVMALRVLGSLFDGTAYMGGEFLLYSFNFGVLPILALLLSLALVVWFARRREFEWALIVLAVVAISHNQAFWRSTVRYTLPFYPLFFWMLWEKPATSNRRRIARKIATGILVGIGLTLQVFYARLFHVGAWAF
ncbi:hypothetical protein BH10BDE1_BH10BDE1_03870 [soil metagenome]